MIPDELIIKEFGIEKAREFYGNRIYLNREIAAHSLVARNYFACNKVIAYEISPWGIMMLAASKRKSYFFYIMHPKVGYFQGYDWRMAVGESLKHIKRFSNPIILDKQKYKDIIEEAVVDAI